MKKNKKKWIKLHHAVVRVISRLPLKIFCKIKFNVKIKKFRGKGNYVVLSNHQTDGDQLFAMLSFKRPIYFLATEDLFSNGFKSRLLEYALAPVPFDKTSTDLTSIKNCVKVVKEGGSLGIFPEGNRTYSGKTEHIKPSIAKLVKLLNIPIAFFKINGGYGVQPRWARKGRKGRITAEVTKVIKPEDYKELTNEELYELIKRELFTNEAISGGKYRGKHKAEYLERAVYTCPTCGLTEWESNGNYAKCSSCGKQIEYLEDKTIKGINGEFAYKNMAEWIDSQNLFTSKLPLDKYIEKPAFIDSSKLLKVTPYKFKKIIDENAKISLYSDRYVLEYSGENETIYFDNIVGVSALGHNKLNINTGEKLLQFKGNIRFNPVKYVNFYFHYKNEKEGKKNDVFLGL